MLENDHLRSTNGLIHHTQVGETMMRKDTDLAVKALLSMRVGRKREKDIPYPTQEDLERTFKMNFKSDGGPVIREVK